MGTSLTRERTGLGDALFSPVQQRVLGLLFGQPQREFQSSELIELVGAGTGATHRILQRLEESGLAAVRTSGRQKYYQANADCPIFAELSGLVRKTVGLVEPLREALLPLADHITAAFVYGSVANRTDHAGSDIDVMLIAEGIEYGAVFEALDGVERTLGRKVNPTLMTPDDWRSKTERANSFAARVKAGPRLFLIGGDDGE